MEKCNYLIIGAGIIGLTIAKEIKERFLGSNIAIIEKENDVALHSSGRNSGVLHAGFYYSSNSLKARFTREGNELLTDYCKKRGLKINECQKVVVAKNEEELERLFELEKRGKINGVDIKIIDEKELFEIDSNAKTYKNALFSPKTSTIDPIEVSKSIKQDLEDMQVKFYFNEKYVKKLSANSIKTASGLIFEADMIINAAGLYADRIAKDFNFSKNFTIIPFKGIYLKYTGEDKPIKTNIYPVPNLKNPFLGVHYTITVDGHIKIGPTAIPAFWRENYNSYSNFKFNELLNILGYEALLFLLNSFNFRDLAFEEIKKYNKKYFIDLAGQIVKDIDKSRFNEWTKPGIRAQLLNTKTLELVQDFIIEGDNNSIHVLNAVSPALTSSFPFAKWVVDNYVMKG
jgi:L-2-hydroxyglutarate oxidase LhgO